jgi:hypothetical protein
VTVSGGTWVSHSGTTGPVRVLSGKVLLARTNNEHVRVSLGQSYPVATNIALDACFTVSSTRFPSSSSDNFAHFKDSGTSGFHDKIHATTNGVPAGFFQVGVANGDNIPNALIASNLNLNTGYTLVTRYVLSNAKSTLWLDPSAETDPSVTATDTTTAADNGKRTKWRIVNQ